VRQSPVGTYRVLLDFAAGVDYVGTNLSPDADLSITG
jgi:hypothetical protein